MTERRISLPLRTLAATVVALTVASATPIPSRSDPLPPPGRSLSLPIPSPSLKTTGCRQVAEAERGETRMLERAFFDDFTHFDPAHTDWVLAYDRPGDPVAAHTHDLNGEQQIYVDATYAAAGSTPLGIDPFDRSGGGLTLVARRLPDHLLPKTYGRLYSSGMLQSKRIFNRRWGYFEASIRIPAGRAFWPAFWLVPADSATPPELDVMESLGHRPDEIYSTLHWSYTDQKFGHLECKHIVPNATERSVIYGVLWTADMIVYYIDRVPIVISPTHANMTRPMYMILNLAVGGPWPGKVGPDTPPEGRMKIDWVAAFAWP